MVEPSPSRPRHALQAAGLGLLAGALEALAVAHGSRLQLGFGEALAVAGAALLLSAALAVALLLPAALVALVAARGGSSARRRALALGLVSFGLAAWHFWPPAWALAGRGGWAAATAAGCVPLAFLGAVFFNARYWLQREEQGTAPRIGFLPLATATALVLALASAAWTQRGPRLAEGQRRENVLIVTIDTLRRDRVSAYGESGAVPTPTFDALAAEGVLFTDAITPLPETAPSHASLFTALHPARHGVLSNGGVLGPAFTTLAERLATEGYDTAAFVSSYAVDSRTGLDQGFAVYDDDFLPALRGLTGIRAVALAQRAVMRFYDPLKLPWLLERTAEDTNLRALTWLRADRPGPFFCWVHYFEPHAPYEPHGPSDDSQAPATDHRAILAHEQGFAYTPGVVAGLAALYDGEVAWADARLGDLLAGLAQAGHRDDTLVVVTADHGEMLGEHGYHFNHHGLHEEAIRVPLAVRAPRLNTPTRVVDAQVRVYDLPATILAYLGLPAPQPSEGLELVFAAAGGEHPSPLTTLIGRKTGALDQGALLGVRSGRPDDEGGRPFKYLWDLDLGQEQLFDLAADPGEARDISAEQPALVAQAHALVAGEARAASGQAVEVDDATRSALRALGYLE